MEVAARRGDYMALDKAHQTLRHSLNATYGASFTAMGVACTYDDKITSAEVFEP
jgi:hypothetical protein